MEDSTQFGGRIYLDKLTASVIKGLIRNPLVKEVIVLEKIQNVQIIFQWFLRIKGLKIKQASFLIGDLRDIHGESVRPAARKIGGKLALTVSSEILKNNSQLGLLNDKYYRNTIGLYIAKKLQLLIEPLIVRALAASALSGDRGVVVWLKKPRYFESDILIKFFQDSNINIILYPTSQLGLVGLIIYFLRDFLSELKLKYLYGNRPLPKNYGNNEKPLVLTISEDHIREDMSYRNHLHWIDEIFLNSNNVGIVDTFGDNLKDYATDFESLNSNIYIFNGAIFHYAYSLMRENKFIKELRNSRTLLFKDLFLTHSNISRFWMLNTLTLLRRGELIAAVSLFTRAKVFLIKEPQNIYADAIQLVSQNIGVTTIAYQYSNLGIMSPLMLSTADKFILFSEMYSVVFSTADIRAGEYIVAGYLMDGIAPLVIKRAQNRRAELQLLGVKFVICFFDESVSTNKWLNATTIEAYLKEIHILAKSVIEDCSLGVIIKSQFIFNSLSKLYPKDELIKAALQTGRFVELLYGSHRNDIYPTEAALSADFCIGYKSGATAALESALLGIRTILLNPYGHKVFFDDLLSRARVEYSSLEDLMGAIEQYRSGDMEGNLLGDWTPIIHYFHPHQKGSSIERLRNIIQLSALK